MIPPHLVYLIGIIPLAIIWLLLFFHRFDLRKEMLIMSGLIGVLSVATGYFWWTVDWWRPLTITGTRVGIEDLLIGFTGGGIMTVVYEEAFGRRYARRRTRRSYPGAFTVLLLLANTTSFLFWGMHQTTFFASTVAMILAALLMAYYRRDLFINGLVSGILMAMISILFYGVIIAVAPSWIEQTYQFGILSSVRIIGIPIEELIFWFLAGFVFGPFYEYWQGIRLVRQQ